MGVYSEDDSPEDGVERGGSDLIEGIARVVAIAGPVVWLEPEQGAGCGSCSASGLCGAKGLGTGASRLELRRFALPNEAGLRLGERVVVGVAERALLKASGTAYAIPLVAMLGGGVLAQWAAGSDAITMAAMILGLGAGLLAARAMARSLGAHGQLAPRFVRRAGLGETCDSD